jgi:GNAT superfamily N-acetyltransferase
MIIADQASSTGRRSPFTPATAYRLTCEIRPLDTVDELIASYRLRHEVYGALGYLQRFNRSELEIDPYDAYSIPFGAFDPESGDMIGMLRLITTAIQSRYEYLIRNVLRHFADHELTGEALRPRPYPFPSLISNAIEQRTAAFNTDGSAVYELSRSIVHPDHRGSGVSRRLMELGLAHAARLAPAVLIGGCSTKHVAMYTRYGYRKLPHTGLDYFASVGQVANAVVCRTDLLPELTRAHVGELVHAMRTGATGHVLEVAEDSHVLFRFAAARRTSRRTREW